MKEIFYDFGYDSHDQSYQVRLYDGYKGDVFLTNYFTSIQAALALVKDLNTAGVAQRHKLDD